MKSGINDLVRRFCPDFDPPTVAKIRYAVPVGIPRVAMHCLRDVLTIPPTRDVTQLRVACRLEPLQLTPIFVRPSVPGSPAVCDCLVPLCRPISGPIPVVSRGRCGQTCSAGIGGSRTAMGARAISRGRLVSSQRPISVHRLLWRRSFLTSSSSRLYAPWLLPVHGTAINRLPCRYCASTRRVLYSCDVAVRVTGKRPPARYSYCAAASPSVTSSVVSNSGTMTAGTMTSWAKSASTFSSSWCSC
jgi:hypothetical protein